jgi:hypothetical protein
MGYVDERNDRRGGRAGAPRANPRLPPSARVPGLALATLLVATLGGAPGCAVQWTLSFEDGLRRAQETGRPMLLYFKDWSSSQHRDLVVQVLQSPVVTKELRDCVNVELLYNWGPEAVRYEIVTPQVCVFCRPDGTEIDRLHVNPVPAPERFADWLRRCAESWRPTTQPVG